MMANIKVESKTYTRIERKPRVYFTCHPEDFEKYFPKICADLFSTHDCAVYYTPNMEEAILPEDQETDLGRHNLFVVPVTLKLLTTPNRAMDADIPYARRAHIPILPFMMEPELDSLYSLPHKFGELQYLSPISTDRTEIPYSDKLKKYLESVLISNQLAQQIRTAFDAYIFLSYRKKDRRYANELMQLIHAIPEFRSTAIWFDEFLTPGESFRESIDRILHHCKLFTLLVTPNLLENNNFIMREEYPAAQASGIPILPAEMEATDPHALKGMYPNLPDCIRVSEPSFHERLLETAAQWAPEKASTPEHTYLIALAYLEGIDMEVNRQYALDLMTAAAQDNYPAAMEKLYQMYKTGIGVALDYRKAVHWAGKLTDYMVAHYGMAHPHTQIAVHNLAAIYGESGHHPQAMKLNEELYALQCQLLGKAHPATVATLHNLSYNYSALGNYHQALLLAQNVYDLRCKTLGEEHPDALSALHHLAYTYGKDGRHRQALTLKERVYNLRCKVLGEEHPDTLSSLHNLASTYSDVGNIPQAKILNQRVYAIQCKTLGPEHPATLAALGNLAANHADWEEHEQALALREQVFHGLRKVLGREHPDTLRALNNLASTCSALGDQERASSLLESVSSLSSKVLGPEHPDTLRSLKNLAATYYKSGSNGKALEVLEKVYAIQCRVLGNTHKDTIATLTAIAKVKEKRS